MSVFSLVRHLVIQPISTFQRQWKGSIYAVEQENIQLHHKYQRKACQRGLKLKGEISNKNNLPYFLFSAQFLAQLWAAAAHAWGATLKIHQ